MEQKKKIIIILIVLAVFASAGILLLRKKQAQVAPAEQKNNQTVSEQKQPQPVELKKTTEVIQGKVSAVEKNGIVVEGDKGEKKLILSGISLVYVLKNSQPETKTAADIKKGASIMSEFDTTTNEVVAIKIL